MKILDSFCAIDFETMTPKRTSACSIGMAKVRDGEIVETFHSLIKPVPDDSKRTNTFVHGITPEMVEDAPTFDRIWDKVQSMIEEFPLVAHNSEFDKSVFSNLLNHYNLADPESFEFQCTYKLTGLKLELACQAYDIDTETHHNAEKDAVMCAKVYLKVSEKDPDKFIGVEYFPEPTKKSKRSFERSTLDPLDESAVENKSTPFFNAKVVITGVFLNYPDRNELGQTLKNLGADINTSISKKTNIVVVGADAGPSKLKKIEDFNAKGAEIRIIREKELKEILDQSKNVKSNREKDPFENANVLINGSFNKLNSIKNLVRILHLLKINSVNFNSGYDDIDIVLAGENPNKDAVTEIYIRMVQGADIKNYTEENFIEYLKKFHPKIAEESKIL